jgi:hypothetical protein
VVSVTESSYQKSETEKNKEYVDFSTFCHLKNLDMFEKEIVESRVNAMLEAGMCERKKISGKDLKKVFIVIISESSSHSTACAESEPALCANRKSYCFRIVWLAMLLRSQPTQQYDSHMRYGWPNRIGSQTSHDASCERESDIA